MDEFDDLLTNALTGTKTAPVKSQSVNANNVGNLRPVGKSTGFQQMESPEVGIKAIDENLKTYGEKHGINTLRGVINRWAPASENDTESYIKNVSQKTGLKPDDKIDLSDPVIRHIISGPIILQEKGLNHIINKQPTQQQIQATDSGDEFDQLLSNAQPHVKEPGKFALEKFTEPLKTISVEDWKKHSILGPLTAYREHRSPETAQALIDAVQPLAKGIQSAVTHPIDTATAIAKSLYENPLGAVGEAVKSTIYDPEQLLAGLVPKANVAEAGAKAITKTAKEARELAPKELSTMQTQFEAKKGALGQQISGGGLQSGGAAAVAHENAVKAALAEATPELRASLGDKLPQEFTPQELKALEIHNKFAKVDPDFVPTEGQALQDIAKLSDEYNQKAQPGNEALRAKFEQRDPMLIKGFNNIKEQFAPEHSGVKLEGKANNILEEVKANRVDVDTANIKKAYGELQSENGKFAVDMKQASENALAKIEAEDRLDKLPKTIKDKLEKYINGAEGNLNKFENLRSDVASEQRLANRQGDGTAAHVLGLVRDALEELPMKGNEAVAFKEKADIARSLFKRQKDLLDPKKPTYNKLYAMAYEDNRTPAEILMGNVPHPAANKFFDNFVAGSKSTPADLSRMIELVGKDSPAHQELIAGLVDHIKQKAGVIDDKGNVNQVALRKELNKLDSRLDIVAGPEVANRLRNIGDVAEMSEHVKNRSGGNANVSQTAITSEREAAQKAIKDVALGATKAALNIKTGGASGVVESVFSPIFEAKKAKKAAEEATRAQQEKLQKTISRSAGISVKPTRIELRGMANKE